MKTRFLVITIALAVLLGGASSAFAWPACSGTWVAVAPEVGSSGGALYTDSHGETWQCQVKVPDTSGSSSNASASSNQSQSQSQTANGGSSSAVGSSAGNNGINYGTVNSGAIASGGTGGSSSSTSAGGNASAVDNAKLTNTSSNTNVNAPVANGGSATATNGSVTDNSKTTNTNTALGGAGGSVKDSGNSSSIATGGSVKDSGNSSSTVKDSGNSTIKDSGNSSSASSIKDSGNSSSTVKDSGNSSNKNTNNVAGSTQSQSSSSVSGSSSAGSGNSTSINTEVEASKIPVATAYAPMIAPTVTCFKGASGAVQTMAAGVSFGVGRIDENCAILEAARGGAAYAGRLAFCKVYITNKYVKKAGVTLDDCMLRDEKPVPVAVAPAPQPVVLQPQIILPPAPVPVAVTPVPVIQRETVQLIGTCPVAHFNACTRLLDSALLRLHSANDSAASVSITGPIEATTKASRYLRDRATDPQRINLHIEDVNEVSISTIIEE